MTTTLDANALDLLSQLNIADHPRINTEGPGGSIETLNPSTNQPLARVALDDADAYDALAQRAHNAFLSWRRIPGPERGQLVRQLANTFREHIEPLGALISLEMGKIKPEGVGEVQEAVDVADFAVGLSRQLYGLTMPSERPEHRLMELWHPLGPVGCITAFNFPVAVWAWNAMLAAACGDSVLWKPSLITPLTSIATHEICASVAADAGHPDLFTLVMGADDLVGERMIRDTTLPLISATGSCRMGRHVAQVVAGRMGRSLLELGGNNAAIILDDADLSIAVPGVVFGAVGTAGQRCTTTRRLLCQSGIIDRIVEKLVPAYESASIGDPLDESTLVGPLINEQSVQGFLHAIDTAQQQGGTLLTGGTRIDRPGNFVTPAIIRIPKGAHLDIARQETFAPILYIHEIESLDEAIEIQNSVDQGLSSAIFTASTRDAETFISESGSDCGIANINLGTSGAEIGGAFGGEKDTGGGRESGSDAWKHYMRRQTVTINRGATLPLAQGVVFG
ncbi:MAG: aldehyde dehydrogenase family protein [Planctomycetota bacterium]|jgi:aldehyde dehydrogenase (NAD+)